MFFAMKWDWPKTIMELWIMLYYNLDYVILKILNYSDFNICLYNSFRYLFGMCQLEQSSEQDQQDPSPLLCLYSLWWDSY